MLNQSRDVKIACFLDCLNVLHLLNPVKTRDPDGNGPPVLVPDFRPAGTPAATGIEQRRRVELAFDIPLAFGPAQNPGL